ncbi:allophanate hydrolase [Amycolatopsis sp. GM8]|uniref:allophanate hydrolase n=1 Tax=Amycolatopsis sp. GM8 TaxID=2896530 RepID=UPI001F00B409|nr:allophanate hydrolase [Amycolatopsis sp. GM8]
MNLVTRRVQASYRRIADVDRPEVWIDLRPQEDVEREAAELDQRLAAGEQLPLAGTVLAVKGNIDVAGLPTTAACPEYAYLPAEDAAVVARLRAAGTVVLGTTNLDQFATGLVGTRSPYGVVRNAVDPSRISGGSSSGSAVAVALGIADLALGTDTAGSGRVPAAFNDIVGLKPTRGLASTRGVVPACQSLDCVSIFSRTLDDAEQALRLMVDPGTPRSNTLATPPVGPYRVGVPFEHQLGELAPGWADAYFAAAGRLAEVGVQLVSVDLDPFLQAGTLLYGGALVAERYTAVGAFIDKHQDQVDPTVGAIISAARDIPAHHMFADQQRLDRLRHEALATLSTVDALFLPTTTDHPAISDVLADPIHLNNRLGRFTTFANVLDLSAVAVPAGTVAGLPFGAMFVGPALSDHRLVNLARLLERQLGRVRLAVLGAHLTGQPLNHELVLRGGRFLKHATTSPHYRLYALATTPAKPGLVRVDEHGAAVRAEVWELPATGFANLAASITPPMAIGHVELVDGDHIPGFLCQPGALHDGVDITEHGGWLSYLAHST